MTHPELTLNYAALAVAVVASFMFGWLWYGPIAGKKWAALMKIDCTTPPPPSQMVKMMVIQLAGVFLTAYVLMHTVQIWRPSVWHAGQDGPAYLYGFFGGFFTWMGFYVPMLLGGSTWEGKPWALFGLNAVYHFINLQIIAMILAIWR